MLLEMAWLTCVGVCWLAPCKGGNALSPLSFVHLPPDVKGQARKDASKVDLASYDPSPLGALMLRMVRSKLSQFPHHSAPLEFFECCVRYSEFFAVWPDTIPLVLQAFLDQRWVTAFHMIECPLWLMLSCSSCSHRGLYQQNRPAQLRAFYLFHKFLMESREQLRKHVSVDMLHQIMSALQPLMTVPTEVTLPEGAAVHEAALEAAVDARGGFDKQLFLFESVGTLTVILSSRPEQQVALLNVRSVVSKLSGYELTRTSSRRPSCRRFWTAFGPPTHPTSPLWTTLSASSASTTSSSPSPARPKVCPSTTPNQATSPPRPTSTSTRMRPPSLSTRCATSARLPSFETPCVCFLFFCALVLPRLTLVFALTQQQALATFKIVSAAIGPAMLDLIPSFIDTVIGELTPAETVDFLPFISLLTNRFRVRDGPAGGLLRNCQLTLLTPLP